MTQKANLLIETLRKLLLDQTVRTQEEIKHALQQQGFAINQSKISRSLHKIGAVKTKNEKGQVIYQLPKEPAPATTAGALANLIIDITHNEIMVIIHTSPGSASLVARYLDHQQKKLNILGTVAGDDTIAVIPKSIKQIENIVIAIKNLLTALK